MQIHYIIKIIKDHLIKSMIILKDIQLQLYNLSNHYLNLNNWITILCSLLHKWSLYS